MTQDELRAAVLAALIDYDTLKKTRRTKAVKEALRNTLVATVIGSAGISTANPVRNNQVNDPAISVTTKANTLSAEDNPQLAKLHQQKVSGVVHFGLNRHVLAAAHKDRLMELIQQLPSDAEITVIAHTDASGGLDYNKQLGKRRAHAVAQFLTEHDIKIKSYGSHISSKKSTGWMARGVDIVVRYNAANPVAINLPPLIKHHYAANSHHQNQQVGLAESSAKLTHHQPKISTKTEWKPQSITQEHAPEQLQDEASPEWWDEKAKLNDNNLKKISWGDNP